VGSLVWRALPPRFSCLETSGNDDPKLGLETSQT
jgi:hypothetical protein